MQEKYTIPSETLDAIWEKWYIKNGHPDQRWDGSYYVPTLCHVRKHSRTWEKFADYVWSGGGSLFRDHGKVYATWTNSKSFSWFCLKAKR